jgi:hypothetical protein
VGNADVLLSSFYLFLFWRSCIGDVFFPLLYCKLLFLNFFVSFILWFSASLNFCRIKTKLSDAPGVFVNKLFENKHWQRFGGWLEKRTDLSDSLS